MADVNINTATIASAINPTDYLHATIGNSFNRITVQTLIDKAKAETLTAMEASLLDKLTEGCFIVYHALTGGSIAAVKASGWTAKQNAGNIADGVLIIEGGHGLVVAPEVSSALKWSSKVKLVGTTVTDRRLCFSDFNGESKTAAIIANETIGGDGTGYAPGFCHAYSRTNSGGYGLTAGKWWLPSIGELLMIYANKVKVNMCLALITGAMAIVGPWHWSSSEKNIDKAWLINMDAGDFGEYTKETYSGMARPVSAYLV